MAKLADARRYQLRRTHGHSIHAPMALLIKS
jgi:hypothetical protein